MNLETIAALAAQFAGDVLTVETEQCLNMRWKNAGCSLCWNACPTQAIHITPGKSGGQVPAFDTQACVRCGLCLRVCPTGVFSDVSDKSQTLVKAVGQQAPGAVMLVCSRVTDQQIDTSADVQAVVRAPKCLASLDLASLITLAAGRDIVLNDAPCTACPLGRNRAAFMAVAAQANMLLAAFEARGRVQLANEQTSQRLTRQAIISANQRVMSRRGFFAALTGRAREASTTVVEEALRADPSARPVGERLGHYIPADRRRLLGALNGLSKVSPGQSVDGKDLPWAEVVVDPAACVACGLCAKFCPTNALKFSAGEDKFVLGFQLGQCVDCGICAKACPVAAVSYASDIPLVHLAGQRTLVEGTLVKCAHCGAPTASTSQDGLCFACRKATAAQNWLTGLASAQEPTLLDADRS